MLLGTILVRDWPISITRGAVLEPCSTGLGGDCFLLYYEASTRKVHGLNGSGMAPAALTLERCLSDLPWASEEIPAEHPHSVTVPGAAAGWCDALSRWGSGSLSLSEILEPAALLAQNGFPVSPVTAFHWKLCAPQLEAGPHGAALLMPNGKPPQAGEVFRNHDMARVLRELGAGGKEAFYEGSIGSAIVDVVRELGGVLSMEDLKVSGVGVDRVVPRAATTLAFPGKIWCRGTKIDGVGLEIVADMSRVLS